MDRLTVVIDGIQLTGESSRSGIGTYVRELVQALSRDASLDLRVIATNDVGLPPGVRRVTVRRLWRFGRRAYWEHDLLRPVALLRSGGQVMHVPNFSVPRLQLRPWVATLYDVAPLVLTGDPSLRHLRRQMTSRASQLARTDRVIAISRHAADGGIRFLGLDPARLEIIYPAASPAFTPDGPAVPAEPPYLLVVSEFQRRKGFDRAFAVVDALADAGYPHVLKVAGRVNPWVRDELHRLMSGISHPERVELLGYVDDLPALYRGARLTLVPSTYEGFGLPAVEAMRAGCPVVSFDNSALPEVVGEGGVLVPDGDTSAMLGAVRDLLDHPRRWEELREAGLSWSGRFSWERSASEHTEVYREAAGA